MENFRLPQPFQRRELPPRLRNYHRHQQVLFHCCTTVEEEAEIEYTKVDITTNGTAKNFIKAEGHKTVPQLYYKHHKINTIDTRDISVNFLKNTLSLYKEQKEDWPWQDSGIEQF